MFYAIAIFAMTIYGQPMGQPIEMAAYTKDAAQTCIGVVNEYNREHSPDLRTCVVIMVTQDADGRKHWQSIY